MWKQSDLLVRAIHKGWIFYRKKQAKLSCLRNIYVPGPLKTIDCYARKGYRTAFFRLLHMAVKPVSSLLICMPWVVPSRSQIQLIRLACCAYFALSKSSGITEQDWMRYGGFDGPFLFFKDGTGSFTWSCLLGSCCKTSHLKSNIDAQSLELTPKDIEEIEKGYDLVVQFRIISSIGQMVDQLGQKMSRRWRCWGILITWRGGTLLNRISGSLMLSGVDEYERS